MVKKINSKDQTYERVIRLFLENPTRKFHIRETATIIGISPRTAKKYLEMLRERELARLKKEKLYDSYSADTQSKVFRDYKVFHTVEMLKESGLVEFIEKKLNYPAIVLYGSAGRGEDIETSDIDMFIVSKKDEEIDVSKFEKMLGRKIHLMSASEKEFKSGRNKEMINNVVNGIVLSGFLEVFE